jgi:hemolysin III
MTSMNGLARARAEALLIAEETANQLTHGLGLLLSIVGAVALVTAATRAPIDSLQIGGCCIYAASLVALYAASTLSHSFQSQQMRQFFRMLDQVCIFLLIAGTFTPFALSYFREGWLWGLTLTMWALTCVGILFKVCFRRLRNVGTGVYVLLGWIPIVAARDLAGLMPAGAMALIVAGGLFYTAGTWFLSHDDKAPYYHAVWHLFVVGASVCHYVAVMLYLIPSA